MALSVNDFQRTAAATVFSGRDVVLQDGGELELGRLGRLSLMSSSKADNSKTMVAFRDALKREYGVFGEHAFDTVLASRAQTGKSLRSCDIRAVLSQMEPLKMVRLENEVLRQIDTSPKMLAAGHTIRDFVREDVQALIRDSAEALRGCTTAEDVSRLAASLVDRALAATLESPRGASAHDHVRGSRRAEKDVAPDAPTGLRRLAGDGKAEFKRHDASVEDRVKSGGVGVGMRINLRSSNPVVFEKLKTNGVEPGFIFRNDWSREDTRSMMMDTSSQACRDSVLRLAQEAPEGSALKTALARGASHRELGLIAGRAHPAGMAFAAERVIADALANPASPLGAALRAAFPDVHDIDTAPLAEIKTRFFVQIRDAVMKADVQGGDAVKGLSVFRHFTDRNIAKLDYNEGDRFKPNRAGSLGKMRLPERAGVKGGAIKGFFYRTFRLTSADSASAGAVAEALANDLTRLAGIPAQELSIIRGKYSDGHPKFMLEAKFADGYRDFDGVYLKDGRIVNPPPAEGEAPLPPIEDFGKYKAMFLLLGDRDAVGSHGQNKGIVNGRFFAIDPGHSLEGNGLALEIRDNLSFRDTNGAGQKRFQNFSVFDDSTRFEKFTGVLGIRELRDSGRAQELFQSYRAQFNVAECKENERALFQKINARIDEMENEFNSQMARILAVFQPQLDLFDALASRGPEMQKNAIETIENLEKITSPTTRMSAHGEVQLRHLEVVEGTRIPWRARVEGDSLVYESAKPLDEAARTNLVTFLGEAAEANVNLSPDGLATVRVPIARADSLFAAVAEENIIAALER